MHGLLLLLPSKRWNDCFSLIFQTSVQAQETIEVKYSKPSWYFGVAGGANFNFYRGSTQQMNASFTSPKHFMMVLGWTFHCTAFKYRLLIQDGVLCYKLVTIAVR
jgi:hypothetical protein